MFFFEENPEHSSKEKLTYIVQQATDWALSHGVIMRRQETCDTITSAPFALFPSVIPQSIFDQAKSLQTDFNLLVHKVAHDYDFLKNSLKSTVAVDEFTRKLWEIYESIHCKENNKKQPICLGIFRNDYMLHCEKNTSSVSFKDLAKQLQLKQVEINTIASSFAGLSTNMVSLHRYTMSLAGYPCKENQIPENECVIGLSRGIVEAWNLYGKPKAAVLFLVSSEEANIFDQKWVEYGIFDINPEIVVLRMTFQEIYEKGYLNNENNLIINCQEIAVVYFRDGYAPGSYKTQQDWDTRNMIECSFAIKCPSINYHLAGTKKIQQELSRPGVLEKFVLDKAQAQMLRNTFVGQYSLDMGAEGDETVRMAMENPAAFVLKPQREGGGNNIYGEDIKEYLSRIKDSQERNAYILMERIFPLPQKNILKLSGKNSDIVDVVSEFGIYGVIIGDVHKIHMNKETGHLVRTKTLGTDEGGIAAGFAAMDSPFLI